MDYPELLQPPLKKEVWDGASWVFDLNIGVFKINDYYAYGSDN
jgi:hypothetical protein